MRNPLKALFARLRALVARLFGASAIVPYPEPQAVASSVHQWAFSTVWNQSLSVRPERPLRARDYVWASEIGSPLIDRYLKMKAVEQTNPPNKRSLRKFTAGHIFEWICALVLRRAGILIETQTKISYQYPGLLKTVGKIDFLAGGQPDWERARREVSSLGLPEILMNASLAIVDSLELQFGNDPLKVIVIEIKSCSAFMFNIYEATGKPAIHHVGQTFHYLKGLDLSEGHIVYISRDDCRLLEFPIYNPSDAETVYERDITQITSHVMLDTRPDRERQILFDPDRFRFKKNWGVEYSPYLTMLYGHKTPEAYRQTVDKPIASFNRVFSRCVVGQKMTTKNMGVIKAAQQFFPDWWDMIDHAKAVAKINPAIVGKTEGDE